MEIERFAGSIIFLIRDPANRRFVEEVLRDIPYVTDDAEEGERAFYQVKNDPLYGRRLIENLVNIIREDSDFVYSDPLEEPSRLLVINDYIESEVPRSDLL